jgi:hypothetical protein
MQEEALRQRRNKKQNKNNPNSNNNNSYESDDEQDEGDTYNVNTSSKAKNKIAKRNQFSLSRLKKQNSSKQLANRLLVGLTFTFGVAAVAMYAINTTARGETPDLLSKVVGFLTYKDF